MGSTNKANYLYLVENTDGVKEFFRTQQEIMRTHKISRSAIYKNMNEIRVGERDKARTIGIKITPVNIPCKIVIDNELPDEVQIRQVRKASDYVRQGDKENKEDKEL